jgi:hypothetical protein
MDRDGCLDPTVTGSYGGGSRSRGEESEKGETEDRLSHRHKRGGRTPVC